MVMGCSKSGGVNGIALMQALCRVVLWKKHGGAGRGLLRKCGDRAFAEGLRGMTFSKIVPKCGGRWGIPLEMECISDDQACGYGIF